jgi:Reverse transcriptase (RNA-dependent DNA polymerase)
MSLPRSFLSLSNFELAFLRLVRSNKSDYKQYYRHIFPSYFIALTENLKILINEIHKGAYEPGKSTLVFHPKKSGVLRPLTLLPFRDLIVYQAIVNVVAAKMRSVQAKHASTRCFGAILDDNKSPFFYRNWRTTYAAFNDKVRASHAVGNIYVADFDLVACYELIDHGILRACISQRVDSEELLDFLFNRCLPCWTTNAVERRLRHGIPQGPDASSFLAECVLFRFDSIKFKNAEYFRYVDDIRLMARGEVPLRRALSAAGKNPHPDYGNWLRNGSFKSLMGQCADELIAIHQARVQADLAHARSKKGKSTRAIAFKEARSLMRTTKRAWARLIADWIKIV